MRATSLKISTSSSFAARPTPFSALSDGYKAFIAGGGDLVGHLADIAPQAVALDSIPGIVLVDEIDRHLHPEWQRNVIPTLAKGFPRLQFIFTSHSPLVASAVRHQNVFVSDTAPEGSATIKQLEERVHGRGAEQLLLSCYFGLQTTRPESFQDEGRTLFAEAAGGNPAAALAYLERLMPPSSRPERRPDGKRCG